MINLLIACTLMGGGQFTAPGADGRPVSGDLVTLDASGATLDTADGKVTLPAGALAELRSQTASPSNPSSPHVWLELVDGSALVGEQYTVDGKQAKLVTLDAQEWTIPTKAIRSVRFHDQNAEVAGQWQEILDADAAGDLIVIRKDESLDYLSGVVGDISADSVAFELEGEKRPVKRSRVEGLRYAHPPGAELAASFCAVRDVTGSRIEVAQAVIAGQELHITAPTGVEFRLPLDHIAAIAFKVQYLSDLEPEKVVYTPYIGTAESLTDAARRFAQPRFNRGFDPSEARLGGQVYDKVIAARSRTELVFRLPRGYRALEGLAGIDDSVRPQGNVRLTISGDDRILLEQEIFGTQDPAPIRVELGKAERLKIVVDFNGDEVGDRLYLANMRLVK